MKSGLSTLALALLLCGSDAIAADPISVDTWFKGPRLQNVSISPDGRYLSMVVSDGSEGYIAVKDLDADGPAKPVFATDPKQDIDAHSCGWVSATRLVCWFTGRTALDGAGSEIRNLVALDPNGGNRRFLLTKGTQGNPLQPNISVLA